MANLKAIRKRIGSVKNTQKITRAMKMVAAARLRRAQQAITELRPYAIKTMEVLSSVASRAGEEEVHPLLARRERKKVLIVALTSDRGLAGAFNANINKAAFRKWKELEAQGVDVGFAVIGRKARDYLRRRNAKIEFEFTGVFENLSVLKAGEIGRAIVAEYKTDGYDEVLLAYNEFKSAISQKIVLEPLLPIVPHSVGGDEGAGGASVDFIYEPSKVALLDRLLPMYVEIEIFRALLESIASEHGARMTAMDNATKNASELVGKLTLAYNRARQAAITTELMEIIGGAEALKG
ncbi:ATP synthase F1 subunit gamma [Sandaracinus amylolyticus]|uniref:ATP synthase gamma chain n=1 Tax=Sandaracinus amylolyticus TaxID=927083 RepID=A0A0F6W2C2_9BACT|nr:ATP synthase F1 subunit gamma [Sandaracinus amylolyticus]AKF05465.1 ATP synthase gamma chain [Sandaracinus amylolyticus]